MYFRNCRLPITWLEKCPKSLVSEDPMTSYMANGPKDC